MSNDPKVSNVTNRLTTALFAIYLIAGCWILLFKLGVRFTYMGKRNLNLVPFNEPSILSSENILNAVIFVPLGVYAGILFARWTFGKKLLFFFALSSIIEGLQYIFRIGAFDVTDIITNTIGGITGLVIYGLIKKAFNNNSVKAQKIVNMVAAVGTALMILLLVLLKMNMLPIKYQ